MKCRNKHYITVQTLDVNFWRSITIMMNPVNLFTKMEWQTINTGWDQGDACQLKWKMSIFMLSINLHVGNRRRSRKVWDRIKIYRPTLGLWNKRMKRMICQAPIPLDWHTIPLDWHTIPLFSFQWLSLPILSDIDNRVSYKYMYFQ